MVDAAVNTFGIQCQLHEGKCIIQAVSPVGRMVVPEEVGDVIAFLCSGPASYINSKGLVVAAELSPGDLSLGI